MKDEEIISLALQSGFMLHSGYGQKKDKLMPVTDSETIIQFARAILNEALSRRAK